MPSSMEMVGDKVLENLAPSSLSFGATPIQGRKKKDFLGIFSTQRDPKILPSQVGKWENILTHLQITGPWP